DREPFAALNGDAETLKYFPSTLDRAASDAVIDRIEACFDERGYGLWALEITGSGQFIGFTGLSPMPDDVPGAGGVEIGWRLARTAWHHGYATEAARAAVTVAFDGLGLPELWSMTAVRNEPSQAVMRRLGMTQVARFDHPGCRRGMSCDRTSLTISKISIPNVRLRLLSAPLLRPASPTYPGNAYRHRRWRRAWRAVAAADVR